MADIVQAAVVVGQKGQNFTEICSGVLELFFKGIRLLLFAFVPAKPDQARLDGQHGYTPETPIIEPSGILAGTAIGKGAFGKIMPFFTVPIENGL